MEKFNILRAGRAVIRVTDLDAARRFYVDGLGFVETEAKEDCIYLRGLEEHLHHSYVLKRAARPGVEVISYRVMQESDLDRIASFFAEKGLPAQWLEEGSQHGIGRALRVQDVSGIPLEFYYKMERVERKLQQFDLYKGSRMQRIDHFNCMVPDVKSAHDFYIEELGFRCSEYTETEEEQIWAAWLHRKPTVHDVAFMNGKGPRLHHVGFWLSDPVSVIHTCDVLASLGYASHIERGPGRHGLSNAFFLYLRDPDGHRVELYTGDYFTGDPDFQPIRWDLDDPRRGTFWGHPAPSSWFEEATPFIDPDHSGQEVALKDAILAQRQPNFVT
ncbi:3,4-dihydroxyphenylacetate 2,3-dioxygenase [Kroppenstedtia sanguinis]|uniref:3,4-dihydroxyphenylacetate 2,3-dioxygenase n=1 Tax=Kroppenstedtia sanguinis TaxID=1380684 RepID=UPI003D1E660E